ncbi:MAG: FixG Ig-like domain-containing protein [Candidatus Hodarchaeaceae archaeon]|nr:FixG Ig-like domain-containing protein [Candidatus Hodarchaeaceae archaeon]
MISILMITATLTFITSSFTVAENPEVIVIVRGKETAFNINQTGDKPWKFYVAGDRPPIMAAQRIGAGAVVAAGLAATARDGRWNDARAGRANPLPHLDILLDKAFRWMKPGAAKVLWYEGYGVYNNTERCAQLVAALEALGYTITGDSTEPITASLLAPYDILVVPQFQLGTAATGGDPDFLPEASVDAIKAFVEEKGKGLLVMDASDYGGHNYYKVQNKILSALGFGLWFQMDQMSDTTNYWYGAYQPVLDVDTTTEIGAAYQAAIGKTEIGLYSICTLAPPALRTVAVTFLETEPKQSPRVDNNFRPTLVTQEPGKDIVTIVAVANTGTLDDNYTVTATDNLGWGIEVSPSTLSLAAGEVYRVAVRITVDPAITKKVRNVVKITASGTGVEDSVFLSTAPYFPTAEPPYPIYRKDEYYYVFSTPSLTVESPAQPIIIGTETACTLDESYREPYPVPFGRGEFPIIAAAAEVGGGRVIVHGGGASFRSAPTDHFSVEALRLREIGSRMVGWLVRYENAAQHSVLFYWTPSTAFHNKDRMELWLNFLEGQGYTVHTYTDGITSERLAPYSVLMFVTPERSLTSAEITAIRDWVLAGGGLFLGEQADYGGYTRPFNTNPILEALGAGIRVQDDQVTDNEKYNRWPWDPRVYLVDHEVWYSPYAVSVKGSWDPGKGPTVKGGEKGVFTLTITNEGTETNTYRIAVTSTKGWPVELERGEVTISPGQSAEVKITITTPKVDAITRDDLKAKVTGTGASDELEFRLTAEEAPPAEIAEIPWAVIAAIVVIVIIAIAAYLTLKRRKKE